MSVALSAVCLIATRPSFSFCLAHGLETLRSPVWRRQAFRGLETVTVSDNNVPYRKQLKDEAKRRRAAGESKNNAPQKSGDARAEKWELTVGIEVHAQLNTERKLFSRMETSDDWCKVVVLIRS